MSLSTKLRATAPSSPEINMPSEPPREVPIQSTSTSSGEANRLRISEIYVRHIPVRLTQLIAFATPRKVDTEHPVAIAERLGEGI